MDYEKLSYDELMKLIEKKRLEFGEIINKYGVGYGIAPSEEVMQKSRELDELLVIAQRKSIINSGGIQ